LSRDFATRFVASALRRRHTVVSAAVVRCAPHRILRTEAFMTNARRTSRTIRSSWILAALLALAAMGGNPLAAPGGSQQGRGDEGRGHDEGRDDERGRREPYAIGLWGDL